MKSIIKALSIGFFFFFYLAEASQSTHIDSATGIETWETRVHGVDISLTQILPEQAQAFYVNRGFTLKQINPYAYSCVYMTVLRNSNAPGPVHFITNNWAVLVNKKPHKLLSVEQWLQRLTKNNIKPSALIAFRWAQFPPEQSYEPGGDWNQGMLSIGLPAGSQFDLTVRWDINGKPYKTRLQGIRCAK